MRNGFWFVPLNIDNYVFLAVFFEMFSHISSVLPHNVFCDGGAIAIPTVPAHRRCFSNHFLVLLVNIVKIFVTAIIAHPRRGSQSRGRKIRRGVLIFLQYPMIFSNIHKMFIVFFLCVKNF